MTIWAVGRVGEPATHYVETTKPEDVIAQMANGETVAPVSAEQKALGVIMLGDMAVEVNAVHE
jgi:hypothetical protein